MVFGVASRTSPTAGRAEQASPLARNDPGVLGRRGPGVESGFVADSARACSGRVTRHTLGIADAQGQELRGGVLADVEIRWT